MVTYWRRSVLLGAAMVSMTGLLVGGSSPAVHADPVDALDGMPDQQSVDMSSADPGNTSHMAGWGDLAGGVESRPYVTSLTVINGTETTQVVTDGSTTPPATGDGDLTTVVTPYNLCRAGQPEQPGRCYVKPNRVALTIAYDSGDTAGYDLGRPAVPLTTHVDADTVFDMTVRLNTLGQSLRWTWVNGDIRYWRTTNLGHPDATVRIRFRPASSPVFRVWPEGTGCTATPIFSCDITKPDSEALSASMVFSLDDTLDPVLTGAAFATQNAIAGFLRPGGTAAAPSLDIQAGSTHLTSDGTTPQLGTLQAVLPAAALVNLYGVLPSDAGTAFTTTRTTADPGTNAPPTYTAWTAAANGTDGLLVTVRDITFSVPWYKVTGKLAAVRTAAKVTGSRTRVTATLRTCSRKAPCLATVYDLGSRTAARYVSTRTVVLRDKAVRAKALSLTARASALRKGDRYLLVVRSARTRKAVASTLGLVR